MAIPSQMSARSTSQSRRERVLSILSDGQFHSGERLAGRLKITRSAVWKIVRTLREIGIEIEAVPKQGYRLPQAVELYDRASILDHLTADKAVQADAVASFDSLLEVDSTNRFLSDAPPSEAHTAQICVAEVQTAGRGRRGRTWLAPFGSGLCVSLAWHFDEVPPTLSALSLATGAAIIRALTGFGAHGIQLKWPNDLLWQRRKLGGVLIEMRGESGGPTRVVIGVGLNVRMPASARLSLAEQQATLISDLHEAMGAKMPGRNALVGALIRELIQMLRVFEQHGFAAFATEWQSHDALKDAAVRVLASNTIVNGVARGAAPDGALLVEIDGQLQRFVSGDVSLRLA